MATPYPAAPFPNPRVGASRGMPETNEDANTPERRAEEDAQRYPAHDDPRRVIDPDEHRRGDPKPSPEEPPVRG
ncbi:MAG: hypothetical protein R3C15_19995 [Thermoleophilia bacterium]